MRRAGEIHRIPIDAAGGLERHRQTLVRDLEAGVDLGPRGAHIQASGRALEALLSLLRAQQAALLAFVRRITSSSAALASLSVVTVIRFWTA